MLKDVIQFSKFRFSKGLKVPYWVNNPSFRVFLRWKQSHSCVHVIWHGVKFWAWGSWHTRVCIVLHVGAFMEGELHLVLNAIFSKPICFPFFFLYFSFMFQGISWRPLSWLGVQIRQCHSQMPHGNENVGLWWYPLSLGHVTESH
jgi:hypothetical protein